MIHIWIANGVDTDAATQLADRRWPGDKPVFCNPGLFVGVEHRDDCSGTVVVGDHPHIVDAYAAAGIHVETIAAPEEEPTADPVPEVTPQPDAPDPDPDPAPTPKPKRKYRKRATKITACVADE